CTVAVPGDGRERNHGLSSIPGSHAGTPRLEARVVRDEVSDDERRPAVNAHRAVAPLPPDAGDDVARDDRACFLDEDPVALAGVADREALEHGVPPLSAAEDHHVLSPLDVAVRGAPVAPDRDGLAAEVDEGLVAPLGRLVS